MDDGPASCWPRLGHQLWWITEPLAKPHWLLWPPEGTAQAVLHLSLKGCFTACGACWQSWTANWLATPFSFNGASGKELQAPALQQTALSCSPENKHPNTWGQRPWFPCPGLIQMATLPFLLLRSRLLSLCPTSNHLLLWCLAFSPRKVVLP